MISAVVGLAFASFLKSTIVNNDLAWRSVMWAQMAALLWATSALLPLLSTEGATLEARVRKMPAAIAITWMLGACGVAYDLVALRAYQPLALHGLPDMQPDPRIHREMRAAYAWLAAHAGGSLVVQHNPNVERALAYETLRPRARGRVGSSQWATVRGKR